ncbi:DNA translocase FtsK [uncultured Cohaesibacter sp.]|uniref:DNA translocase FtsK n=1 Tax=uncultured Cohaesibacter sp. TaxID=1002546 RepID=UPI002AABF8C4|nr:DNA translocase FtsK [uncultured Cohaesibacter sp.]
MTTFDDYRTAPYEGGAMGRRDRDGALKHALRRNAYAGLGLLGLLLCAVVATSLVTWHVADPSLSNATEVSPRNAFGLAGAIISDLSFQGLGLASAFLIITPTVWFWRLVLMRPARISRNRFMGWFAGLCMLAIACSTIPVPDSWPLPLSLGGMVGDAFLSVVSRFDTEVMQGLGAVLVGAGTAFLGVLILLASMDMGLKDLTFRRKPAATFEQEEAEPYDEADYEEDDWDEEDSEAYAQAPDGSGTLDRTKGPASKRGSFFSVPIGALNHWYLSRRANKARKAREREIERQEKAKKPSFFSRLLADDDDGLDALTDRMEPRLERSAQPGYQQQKPGPAPDMGYSGPEDFAPQSAAGYEDYDEEDDWNDDGPYQSSPVGIAPPELNRPSSQPGNRAETNERAQTKPAGVPARGGKGKGKRMVKAGQGNLFSRQDEYQFPSLDILSEPESLGPNAGLTADQLEHNARLLEGVLSDFGIRGEIIKVRPGPVVTLYELEPAPGIKSSRVIGLADDIARSMSAISARVAVVPGRNAIGIELPNARRETVYLREMLASKDFEKSKAKLPICLGKNISGDPVVVDLARMPHVLVAGTTGSGKSVSINTTILSLLYRHRPEECRLIMIDPKMLELSVYDGIPHLLTPVVTDPSKAVVALKWAVREMEQRYKNMSKMGVRNIDGFNKRVRDSLAKGDDVTRTIQTGFDPDTGEPIYEQETLDLEPMPFIVIIVDEMADLMMVAGKDIEGAIQRLAQMARAAGIHLIMATQRPSVDVITGTIKANFPTRMSFQVTSKIDSRTILGEMGAEQLLGMGDMLYMAGGGRIQRVHGAFVADEEVEEIVAHLKLQGTPDYLEAVTEESDADQGDSSSAGGSSSDAETLYDKAVDIVLRDRKASTSYIQRRLSIGYNRAATLIEQMEQQGVISPANHAGKREILVPEEGATM